MLRAERSDAGPMPLRRRSLGVSIAPAVRMTSLREEAKEVSLGSEVEYGEGCTFSPVFSHDANDFIAFEDQLLRFGAGPDFQVAG